MKKIAFLMILFVFGTVAVQAQTQDTKDEAPKITQADDVTGEKAKEEVGDVRPDGSYVTQADVDKAKAAKAVTAKPTKAACVKSKACSKTAVKKSCCSGAKAKSSSKAKAESTKPKS